MRLRRPVEQHRKRSARHTTDLKQLAEQAVARALALGATDAEAVAVESEEFSVNVRLGQVEQLTESGSRALGLRVLFAEGAAAARPAPPPATSRPKA
jgi:predicted Zn-dependent protease